MTRLFLFLALCAPLFATDDEAFARGRKDVALSGSIYLTHDSPADSFGLVTGRAGYFFAKNQEAGLDATLFAYSRTQDLYLNGFYRYYFAQPGRKLVPFLGASAGSNVLHLDYFGRHSGLLVGGEGGVRLRLSERSSFEVGYHLLYRRQGLVSMLGKTSSLVTFGFARTF